MTPSACNVRYVSNTNGTLTLHAPQCASHNRRQCDCDRIDDAYAFCRSVVHDHVTVGARRANGTFTGPSTMSQEDVEDLVQYLVTVAWTTAERFNGKGRLNGWVLSIVNKRVIDWKRSTWHQTRYGPSPIFEELNDAERQHVADLVDLTGPEVLELVNSVELAPPYRKTLRLVVIPIVFAGASVEDYAERSGKPVAQVQRELGALRRELVRKELIAA